MSQQELLKRVVSVLESHDIAYMLTGSIVSSLQGEPRASHDIDLVTVITSANVPLLTAAFAPDRYYLDEIAVREAIARGDMFNLLDNDTGDKIDFWLLTDDAFDQSRFSRRQQTSIGDTSVFVSTPEDTILQKLKWAQLSGGSEKQFADARAVYELQFENLDLTYIQSWAKTLDIEALWERLKTEAQPL